MCYFRNFLIFFLFVTLFSCNASKSKKNEIQIDSSSVTINLKDNERPLTNPGMGWNQMYYTYDGVLIVPDDEKNDFEIFVPCDIVSFRLSWAAMEPREGQYNWELIEDIVTRWTLAGKRVAFKWYTNFLLDNAKLQATPLWVKDAGSAGRYLGIDSDKSNDTWMASYDDPILLQKLGNFYKAAAEHYKSVPIEFIELGSIGRVGEGNSYQIGIEPTEAALKKHIDLFRDAFPNKQLIINDDYGKNACLYAKSKGYGVDDHSISVGGKSGDPNNTGRAYDEEIIGQYFHDGTAPIGLENDTWFQIDDWYLKQMIDARANYCRIHQKPSLMKDPGVQTILKQMNLRMGYRIQFPEIQFPENITKGNNFKIKFSIKNAGVGYCLNSYFPLITIKDDKGQVIATSKINNLFNVNSLRSSADSITLNDEVSITIPTTSAGNSFSVYISMADIDKNPTLNLPYSGNDGKKRYLIHQLKIN